ncbi:EamA family transporter [Pseudomonas sp. NFXW11]|uniref:EamA family transporter n=1 Tax=Pseudomonas sp. NFXW11 TaxID=2819531 RepID=UPI003CE778E6
MQKKHLLLALLVTALWGLNFPITKLGLASIDPLLLTALRFALAALPWVFLIPRPQVAWGWLAAYGLIFGVAMWALINLGIEQGVAPGTAALLVQFSAFFSLGWGVLLLGERVRRQQLLAIGIALWGLLRIIGDSPGQATSLGYWLLLVSAFSWSLGNLIIKYCKVQQVLAFVVWASLFAPLPLLALTWMEHGVAPFQQLPGQLSGQAVLSLLFQVYVATHFCYWGWNLLLSRYPLSRVAPWSLLIPLFGTLGSVLILGQGVTLDDAISMALILAALVVGQFRWRSWRLGRSAA